MSTEQRVLLIDDSDDALEFMARILSEPGHTVFRQHSGAGAADTIREHNIDIVLIDVQLAHERGDEVAKQLRAQPDLEHVGILLVSGRPESELKRIANEAGADGVISKRDLEEHLLDLIDATSGN